MDAVRRAVRRRPAGRRPPTGGWCCGRSRSRLLAVDAYAVAEWIGHPPVEVTGTTDRFGGPFGSPALLGAAVVLLLPVAVGTAFDTTERRAWRGAGALAAVGALVPLLGSGSRAALVALAVALVVGGAAVGVRTLRTARRRWLAVSGLAVVAVLVLIAVTPVGDRLAATVDPGSGVARSRLDEWRVALDALGERPVLGVGPEGYRIAFPGSVDDAYVREHGRSTVTDRAHAGLLDVGLSSGLPGALAYAALVGLVVVHAVRARAVGRRRDDRAGGRRARRLPPPAGAVPAGRGRPGPVGARRHPRRTRRPDDRARRPARDDRRGRRGPRRGARRPSTGRPPPGWARPWRPWRGARPDWRWRPGSSTWSPTAGR